MELDIDNIKELLKKNECSTYITDIIWVGKNIRIIFIIDKTDINFCFEVSCAKNILEKEFDIVKTINRENAIAIEIKQKKNLNELIIEYQMYNTMKINLLDNLIEVDKKIDELNNEMKKLL